jgi:hypothetical protein
MGDSRSRRRLTIILIVLVCLGLLAWLLLRGVKSKPPGSITAVAPTTFGAAPPASQQGPFDPRAVPAFFGNEPAPVIDSITVEKPEVCEGEENLITVRAHTVNGTDAFLHYLISDQTGQQVPLKSWITNRKNLPPRIVTVFGRGNAATTVQLPAFLVKDCQPYRSLVVRHRARPNTEAEYDFFAFVTELGSKRDQRAEPFKPVQYQWSFGDGTTATTTVPVVTHSFEHRPQDTLYSQFLIGVEASSAKGEKLMGRMSFQLMNHVFEDLSKKGVLRLLFALEPRFPEIKDGKVTHRVRAWHTRPDPVAITKVTVVHHYYPTKDQAGVPETEALPGEIARILGQTDIPPGPGIETVVTELGGKPRDWFQVDYLFEGETVEGWPARGAFSVLMPSPTPTKDRHVPVTDETLLAKIRAARKILGKDTVSDEDIWRLEWEGKLDDVVPRDVSGKGPVRGPAAPPPQVDAAPAPEEPSPEKGKAE